MINKPQLSDDNKIIWSKEELPTEAELEDIIQSYLSSQEYILLNNYNKYYDVKNPKITNRYIDRFVRDVTPNELVPSAYYKTVVDTMASFMFQNIQVVSENEEFVKEISSILNENEADIKDMVNGVNALAFNKGIEIIYTIGDGNNPANIKFATVDPRQMIIIYDDSIEPQILCGIRITESTDKDYDYEIDVIYADKWQYYYMKGGKISEREKEDELPWFNIGCPVIVYKAEIINNRSPFDQILHYIDALDMLLTNNANDINKLADAILKLSQQIGEEDKKHLDEIRVIEGLSKDDIAEFITKDMTPEFREYVSKLFVKEIHKHSHTIDWFDSENVGDVSGRALRIRLFDMNMYSKRIEKVYKKGYNKRIDFIKFFMNVNDMAADEYEVVFNRELPDNFLDIAPILQNISFISTAKKLELAGIEQDELQRVEEEKKKNMETFMNDRVNSQDDQGDEIQE